MRVEFALARSGRLPRRRRNLFLAVSVWLSLSIFALAGVPATAGATTGDTARGTGIDSHGLVFDFHATATSNSGDAIGTITVGQFEAAGGGVRRADVYCMRLDSPFQGVVLGKITASNNPFDVGGTQILWILDLSQFWQPDALDSGLAQGTQLTCDEVRPANASPIRSGDVTIVRAPEKQCSNGSDDDGDGQVDYPNDPGCSSPDDDSEAPDPTQCSNGSDDDGDGKVDYPNDPGCSSPDDDSEAPDPTPMNKGDCKNGGWRRYPWLGFKNQGGCVSYVATRGKNHSR